MAGIEAIKISTEVLKLIWNLQIIAKVYSPETNR